MNQIMTQPTISFFDLRNKRMIPEIWDKLTCGLWRDFSVDGWLSNELLPPTKINHQKPLFGDIMQILPGTIWDKDKSWIVTNDYTPQLTSGGIDKYMKIMGEYIENLGATRIGVHLSGGLDSSLIIATLKRLGIPFVPIGVKASSYEFRTERVIQEALLSWGEDGQLIDYDLCPFYAELDSFPATQIPSSFFKSYAMSSRLADAFRSKGCDVVLGGQGGDSLFVEAIDDLNKLSYNIDDEFIVSDEQDLVYATRGIRLLSVFAHKPLIDFICSERLGQKDDPLKWWARNYFKDILPLELSQYAYFGDFFAMTMSALQEERLNIKNMMDRAFEWTSNSVFSSEEISRFMSQDIFSFEHNDYIKFCSLIAVAVWYNSLYNANIIR